MFSGLKLIGFALVRTKQGLRVTFPTQYIAASTADLHAFRNVHNYILQAYEEQQKGLR